MIDIDKEALVAINDVPGRVPTGPSLATAWRWINKGCKGVRLETIMIGGRRYTSDEALRRFFEASTAITEKTY